MSKLSTLAVVCALASGLVVGCPSVGNAGLIGELSKRCSSSASCRSAAERFRFWLRSVKEDKQKADVGTKGLEQFRKHQKRKKCVVDLGQQLSLIELNESAQVTPEATARYEKMRKLIKSHCDEVG